MCTSRRIAAIAAGSLAMGAAAAPAFGELIYDINANLADDGFFQQSGNADYYYGDTVQLAPSAPRSLTSIKVSFALFTYTGDGAGNAHPLYTPNLKLDLFTLNANNLPVDFDPSDSIPFTPFATSSNNTTQFTGHNYNAGDDLRDFQKDVTFPFSNVTLPDKFAFCYHDSNPQGDVFPNYGFSVFVSNSASSVPGGSSIKRNGQEVFIEASPNFQPQTFFSFVLRSDALNKNIEAEITAVPEPGLVGGAAAALGAVLMRRRRRAP